MIWRRLKRVGVVLSVAVLLSGILSPVAHAADPANPEGAFNVVVSPPSIGLEVAAGKTVSTDLKIQNQGLSTEHVKVSLMKFGAKGQDGTPSIDDLTPTDEFGSWVTFSTTKFDAAPSEWKTVKMTIKTPPKAAFGYYYAVVFSREGAEKQIQQKQANLLGAVASLVLLDVQAPGAIRQTKIAEFSTPNKVQEFLPVTFTVRMQNTGNTHVAPRGNIIISKGGKNLAILEVNLKKGFILPGTYRKFTVEWTDGTPVYKTKADGNKDVLDKQGKPVKELNWDKFSAGKLRMGKYQAKLVMVYDDGHGDVSTEAKLSFWVMPWRILAVGGAVLLLVLAGLWAIVLRPLLGRRGRNRGYVQRR